jgi:restriction endonuclease-like protein
MPESEIERLFREAAELLWPADPPLVQEYEVRGLDDGKAFRRLDFALPGLKMAIELDGHATHSSPDQIAADRRRQRALEDAGWKVRRYGGKEVMQDAQACVRDALKWAGLMERPREPWETLESIANGLTQLANVGDTEKAALRVAAREISKVARQLERKHLKAVRQLEREHPHEDDNPSPTNTTSEWVAAPSGWRKSDTSESAENPDVTPPLAMSPELQATLAGLRGYQA